MKRILQTKGISLVALIITIVVLVILVTTVVLIILEDNNIIERAKQAVEEYKIAEEQALLVTKLMDFKTYNQTHPQTDDKFLGDMLANYFNTNNLDIIVIEGFPSKIVNDATVDMSQNINVVKCGAQSEGSTNGYEIRERVNGNICVKLKNSNYVYEVDGESLTLKGEATRENECQQMILAFNGSSKEFYIQKLGLQQVDESEPGNQESNSRLIQTEDMKELIKEINEIEKMIYRASTKGDINYTNLNDSKDNSTLNLSSEIMLGISRYGNSNKNLTPAESRIRDIDQLIDISFNVNSQKYRIEKCIRGLEQESQIPSDETYIASIQGNKITCNITKSGVIVINPMRNIDMESLLM